MVEICSLLQQEQQQIHTLEHTHPSVFERDKQAEQSLAVAARNRHCEDNLSNKASMPAACF